MPLFMDIHKHVPGLTKEAVEGAHAAGLATQDKHNVNYMQYWFTDTTSDVFCLIEAMQVQREAHGLLAGDIIEVREGR